MPKQVQHWNKIRDISSAELKSLVEKQIVSTAYSKLGNFREKILLSLPPPKKSKGLFNIGTILYKDEKWLVGLSKSELLQNISIFGRSGAGKTNVAFHIMKQLEQQKIPFLFLDWKRTARHLLPYLKQKVNIYTPGRKLSLFSFNPFIAPPGLEYKIYINQVVDILADAYTLGDGAKSILQKALSECYEHGNTNPTAKDIIEQINNIPNKTRISQWKITALRAMESLAFSEFISTQINQQDMATSLLYENTIIELDALSENAKKFIIPLLCLWLYYVKLNSSTREKLDMVIFLEEAHHVLYKQEKRSKETLLEMLLRQYRELGIATIIVDQHPHLISSAALGNCYTSICLNQKDPVDINKAAALSLVQPDERRYFSMLPIGQGIVKLQDRWHKPFLVQIPLVRFQKGAVTDRDISRYFGTNQTGSTRKTFQIPKFREVQRVHFDDIPLNAMELAFIDDILLHKDDGVKQRYKRLEMSIGGGNKIKEKLIHDGWLESDFVKVGKSRKVILRLTSTAQKSLGFDNIPARFGSVAHEYWKRYYGRLFQDYDYRISFETPRKSGRIDVVAAGKDEKIAVEIETGKSDVVRNVKQDLLSAYSRILVVATDKSALKKVEKLLAKKGLIIPKRIEIILAGEFPNFLKLNI